MIKKGVDIPKGIPHNARINVEEGGDNPVEIVVQHPTNLDDGWKGWRLNSDTRNLEITVPITLEEALIGKTVSLEHPGDGSVEISIESGTQPGTKIIKKDRGLPPCPDAKMPPSSAIIEIQVIIPKIPPEHHENTRRFFEIIQRSSI
jgi:DnaJ-class molecular chaperone